MKTHSRKRTMILASIVGGLAALSSTPAIANAAGTNCSTGSGNVCIYNNANYAADPAVGRVPEDPWSSLGGNYPNMNGATDTSDSDYPSPHTYNNPSACNDNNWALTKICNINDSMSSARNRSSTRALRLYKDSNFSGGYQTISAGGQDAALNNNDTTSSYCQSGTSKCPF